jgi:acetoin:2,6-dichlorophenolindophenol oxidoreductase subunit beta
MFGGQARVPLVVREPIGMWRSSAAQHSQSLEAWYIHTPGLVVVTPATPADNYALLKAAIRTDDPVVYMEHKNLWGLAGEVDDTAPGVLGRARIVRPGSDLTLATWSAMLHEAATAATLAEAQGIAVELIDLRTLWPWDREMVLSSTRRTGRLLIVHEAVQAGGFGAEIAASAAEELFGELKAPVRRLGAPRIPIGYAPSLEDQARIFAGRDILPAIVGLAGRRR